MLEPKWIWLISRAVGTTFQVSDLFMYLAGCLTVYLVDVPGRHSRRG